MAIRIPTDPPTVPAAEDVGSRAVVAVQRRVVVFPLRSHVATFDTGGLNRFWPECVQFFASRNRDQRSRVAAMGEPPLLLPPAESRRAIGYCIQDGIRHRLPIAVSTNAGDVGEGRIETRLCCPVRNAPGTDRIVQVFVRVYWPDVDISASLPTCPAHSVRRHNATSCYRIGMVDEPRQIHAHAPEKQSSRHSDTTRRIKRIHSTTSSAKWSIWQVLASNTAAWGCIRGVVVCFPRAIWATPDEK